VFVSNPLMPYVHAFVTCSNTDSNLDGDDSFYLLGFGIMHCGDGYQPFGGFIIFLAHSQYYCLSRTVYRSLMQCH
jgi:hypothetical protein